MEDKTITIDTPAKATAFIFDYLRFKGIDPADVDFGVRPKNLPEDVARAWDILEADQDAYEDEYGVIDG